MVSNLDKKKSMLNVFRIGTIMNLLTEKELMKRLGIYFLMV